jgi:hypothetical protein
MLYNAVNDMNPIGDGRKEAYKIMKEADWVVPDDWWAQRARDHGTMELDESEEA